MSSELTQKAMEAALAESHDEHSAQAEELRRRLQEAEERSQRAMPMAQQTKPGNVYVISNIGRFGDGLHKIRVARRLEPMDRVRE